MRKFISLLLFLVTYVAIAQEQNTPINPDCTIEKRCSNGEIMRIPLHGKVKIVKAFGDFKVQVVSNFEDLNVKLVEHFPNNCGEWQIVENFEDFSIEIVDAFPDFTIKYVDAFPGVK